jgi:hypothetical protein
LVLLVLIAAAYQALMVVQVQDLVLPTQVSKGLVSMPQAQPFVLDSTLLALFLSLLSVII